MAGLFNLFSGSPASPGTAPAPQGLLDMLLGGSNPVAQFADNHQNVLGAIGAGLGSQPNFGNALGAAAQAVPQARKADYQLNLYKGQVSQTVAYLQKTHPDLAQAVQSGTLSPADAFNMAFAQDNQKGVALEPGATLVNPQTGARMGGASGQPTQGADPSNPPVGANMGQPFPGSLNGKNVMLIATQFGGPRVYGAVDDGSGAAAPGAPQAGFDQFGNTPAPQGAGLTIQSPAQVAAQTAGLTDRAKANAAKPEQRVAAETAMSQLQQSDALNKTFIQTAIKQADDLGSTGWVGKLSEAVPGTPAYKLAKTLDTVRANIGFDKLQAMRAASPSGGALGQVSNFEEQLLQSVQGSLDQGQDAATIKANLTRLLDYMQANDKMRQDAFQKDFGGASTPYGGGAPTAGAAAPAASSGQTFTYNPATGQLE